MAQSMEAADAIEAAFITDFAEALPSEAIDQGVVLLGPLPLSGGNGTGDRPGSGGSLGRRILLRGANAGL
jgi:hypothetical protein